MENSFQTSFIPKRPINSTEKVDKAPKSIFTILSIIIFIIVILSSIGFFFYKRHLINQKEILSASLLKVRGSFQKDIIDELELFDKRIKTSKSILNNHIVLSPTFKLLGDLTIPAIQYTKFEQTFTEKGFHVNLSGISKDYRSIALQADIFNTSRGQYFNNIIFSNLTKNKNNYVIFSLEFDIDPSLLSYEKNFNISNNSTPATTPTNPLPGNTNSN